MHVSAAIFVVYIIIFKMDSPFSQVQNRAPPSGMVCSSLDPKSLLWAPATPCACYHGGFVAASAFLGAVFLSLYPQGLSQSLF